MMTDPLLRPGTNHCLCAACGEYFTSDYTFRMHRKTGPEGRYCADPSKLVTKKGIARLRQNRKGLWASTRLIPEKE